MAEEQTEITHQEQWDSTLNVMQDTLAELRENEPEVIEAQEEPVNDEPEQSAEPKTDSDTPTYQAVSYTHLTLQTNREV